MNMPHATHAATTYTWCATCQKNTTHRQVRAHRQNEHWVCTECDPNRLPTIAVCIPHRQRATVLEIQCEHDLPTPEERDDLHSYHEFHTLPEAEAWANGYTGHQHLLVRGLLEQLRAT